MAYATIADLKSRLGVQTSPPGLYNQLTDRLAGTTASDSVGQEILDGAHGRLDAYLAARYAVPVDAAADAGLGQFLKNAVLTIAEFDAWQGHPMRQRMPDRVGAGYRELTSLLQRIADGKSALPGAAPVPGATSSGATATAIGFERVTNEDAMNGLL